MWDTRQSHRYDKAEDRVGEAESCNKELERS